MNKFITLTNPTHRACFFSSANYSFQANLEELVDFTEVYSLLGIQLVDVADVSIHQIKPKPHHL